MQEIIKVNMKELKSFDERKFNPKALYQTDNIKVIAAFFLTGTVYSSSYSGSRCGHLCS